MKERLYVRNNTCVHEERTVRSMFPAVGAKGGGGVKGIKYTYMQSVVPFLQLR